MTAQNQTNWTNYFLNVIGSHQFMKSTRDGSLKKGLQMWIDVNVKTEGGGNTWNMWTSTSNI